MTVGAALLLLADSRLPAGGHAHSGGVETAVARGLLHDIASLREFLLGRLATAATQAAAVAAYASRASAAGGCDWTRLDAEVSARMPSAAQRTASRAQGRSLRRVAQHCWPHPVLTQLGDRPHHGVVLGVVVTLVGGSPRDAAAVAASSSVAGPASAALRLLGLDPVEVTRLLAELSGAIDRCADDAASRAVDRTASGAADAGPEALPSPSAPMLDVLAEEHARSEVKLFAS